MSHLNIAEAGTDKVIESLQAALHEADAIEALVLYDLIKRASKLQVAISVFASAMEGRE
jgi:hypothetical protein